MNYLLGNACSWARNVCLVPERGCLGILHEKAALLLQAACGGKGLIPPVFFPFGLQSLPLHSCLGPSDCCQGALQGIAPSPPHCYWLLAAQPLAASPLTPLGWDLLEPFLQWPLWVAQDGNGQGQGSPQQPLPPERPLWRYPG